MTFRDQFAAALHKRLPSFDVLDAGTYPYSHPTVSAFARVRDDVGVLEVSASETWLAREDEDPYDDVSRALLVDKLVAEACRVNSMEEWVAHGCRGFRVIFSDEEGSVQFFRVRDGDRRDRGAWRQLVANNPNADGSASLAEDGGVAVFFEADDLDDYDRFASVIRIGAGILAERRKRG